MTRYSDNIYSGYQSVTSALSSRSAVDLCKVYNISAGTGVTQSIPGTFPPGTQGISARLYVTQQGAATTSDNIILYVNGSAANGQKVLSFLAVGSAAVSLTPTTFITSAAAQPPVPSNLTQNYSGEIPFKVVVSSTSTAAYQIKLTFNRADTNTLGTTQ